MPGEGRPLCWNWALVEEGHFLGPEQRRPDTRNCRGEWQQTPEAGPHSRPTVIPRGSLRETAELSSPSLFPPAPAHPQPWESYPSSLTQCSLCAGTALAALWTKTPLPHVVLTSTFCGKCYGNCFADAFETVALGKCKARLEWCRGVWRDACWMSLLFSLPPTTSLSECEAAPDLWQVRLQKFLG